MSVDSRERKETKEEKRENLCLIFGFLFEIDKNNQNIIITRRWGVFAALDDQANDQREATIIALNATIKHEPLQVSI